MKTQSDTPEHTQPGWHSVEWLNAGVMWIDQACRLTVGNALAAQLLNVVVKVGEPVPLHECLAEGREEHRLLAGMVAAAQEVRNHLVTWAVDGGIRHVLIDSFRQESADGTFLGLYVFMKDLGNFTVLDQHLQRTDKLATVGKIAAGIAHEIRNPLTTLKGFLQVMENRLSKLALDDELEYTRVMMTEIERVNALVGELLLLSKPHNVEKKPCVVETLLKDLYPLIQSQAALCGVQYAEKVDAVPDVVMDPVLMKQVILNLVKNALEAMESGGELRISVHHKEPWLYIDVSDTGPGIPYYQVDQIFDAFYTTKDKGTGLGLPICQRIVDDHGGEIRVSSKGFGTTFSILLPVCGQELSMAT